MAASLTASLEPFAERDARQLVQDVLASMRARSSAGSCEHVVVAVLSRRLFIDASPFGRGTPCGLMPPASILASLEFLAGLMAAKFAKGTDFPDAVFVLAGSEPETDDVQNTVPSFLHAKPLGHAQRGVLVPGPHHVSRELDPKRSKTLHAGGNAGARPAGAGTGPRPGAGAGGRQVGRGAHPRANPRRKLQQASSSLFQPWSPVIPSEEERSVNKEGSSDAMSSWPARYEKLRDASSDPAWRAPSGRNLFKTINDPSAKGTNWNSRRSRAFWRGRLPASDVDCEDFASWTRVEAVALTLAVPDLVDARLTHKLPASLSQDEAYAACDARIRADTQHTRHLRRVLEKDSGTARAQTRSLGTYMGSKYALLLPEQGGCEDENAASVWGLGASVLKWDTTCVEWYEPTCKSGETHLGVNVRTLARVADLLGRNDATAQYLARQARELHARYFCPNCVAQHWAKALRAYRSRFGLDQLTQPKQLETLLLKSGLDLYHFDKSDRPWSHFLSDALKREQA